MPSVTRSAAHKAKEEEKISRSAKKAGGIRKNQSNSGLRRSCKDLTSQKQESLSSSPSSRKSERLSKNSVNSSSPTTPQSKEKKRMPSLPENIEEGIKQKCSGFANNLVGNEPMVLEMGASCVFERETGEELSVGSVEQAMKKRLDGRSYRKLLTKKVKKASSPGTPPEAMPISITSSEMIRECLTPLRNYISAISDDISLIPPSSRVGTSIILGASVENRNEKSVDTCPMCGKFKSDRSDSASQSTSSLCNGECDPTNVSSCQEKTCAIISSRKELSEQKLGVDEQHILSRIQDDHIVCEKCKLGGMLLCCNAKDCRRSYHLSCLNPPLTVIPLGIWHCPRCTLKKIKFGVHSVSPGIESICDVRDTTNGGKQYLVKFKGLAFVHTCWLQEGRILERLLEEAPQILDEFKKKFKKEKAMDFNYDWLIPQRLVAKRLVLPSEDIQCLDEQNSINYPCEWLVKWKGLGYENATWELETASFLISVNAIKLKSDFERRVKEAKKFSFGQRSEKLLNVRKGPRPIVTELPMMGSDSDCLTFVNRILGHWHKGQNAIVVDVKEHIMKTALFILSVKRSVSLPVIIVSSSQQIVDWEAEFLRLDPSLNVVAYVGDKYVRRNIQMLEFFESGGSFMVEVVLSTPNAIIEDIDSFKSMESWGVVVVDGTCGSEVWEHLEHMRNISSDFKLLLTGAQMKDNVPECISILSFLDTVDDVNSNLALLKKKIDQLIAFEGNALASHFLEYWVPIPLSDVQLEQYCHTLMTNYSSLRTYLKSDQMGVLNDVLLSVRKCCDHPYLLSPGLQTSLSKNVQAAEILQIGINACGKLRFLDKILSEMKNRGQRALILFQSIIGSDKISNGDILDDFLRQRFGGETYERIDVGLVKGKKGAALNAFNDVKGKRFVLLLENRACRSSIKLSSIDAIIIFGSEWNPLIDLKTLMKIQIDSGSEQMKLFRLYTPYTVEEKALLMLNQDNANLDFNIQNISPPNRQALLSWGASSLFKNLDEFHLLKESTESTTSSGSYSCGVDLDAVVMEVLNEVGEDIVVRKSTAKPLLTRVRYNGTTYVHDGSLLGAAEFELKDSEVSSDFWCKLLEGRSSCWKYFSESLPKTRKRAIPCDKIDEQEVGEIKAKKRQKVVNNVEPLTLQSWIDMQKQKVAARKMNVDLSPPQSPLRGTQMGSVGPNKGQAIATSSKNRVEGMHGSATMATAASNPGAADVSNVEFEGSRKLRNGQKSLHMLLEPEILRICHILELPENVKSNAETLLEYVMLNHHVTSEPKAILHAFLLSLCWRAASLTSFNVNHKKSLLVARKLLDFACQEHEAEFVYLKICEITKKFSKDVCLPDNACMNLPEKQFLVESVGRQGSVLDKGESNFNSVLSDKGEGLGQEVDGENSVTCDSILNSKGEALRQEIDGENSVTCNSVHSGKGEGLGQEVDGEHYVSSVELSGSEEVSEACGRVERICNLRNQQILLIESSELCSFNKLREELIKNLEDKYGSEDWFPRKLNKLTWHMDKCYRTLADKQKERRAAENKIKAQWLLEARAGTLDDLFDEVPLAELPFNIEDIRISAEKSIASDGLSNKSPISCDFIPSLEIDDTEPNQLIAGKDITYERNPPGLSKDNVCVVNSAPLFSSSDKECQVPLVEPITSRAEDGDSDRRNRTQRPVSSNSGSVRTNVPDILQTNRISCSRHNATVVQQSLLRPTTQFSHENYSGGPPEQLVIPSAEPTGNMVITEHATRPQQRNDVTSAQRPQFVSPDPLQIEMEKILRQKELSNTMMEDEKNRLNLEREKEIQEINKKYDNLLQDAELKFQQTQSTLDSNYRRVCLNRILAEAYKYRSSGRKLISVASQGLTHPSRQTSSNDTDRRAVLPHLQSQRSSSPSRQTALDPLSHHGPSFDAWLASVDQ